MNSKDNRNLTIVLILILLNVIIYFNGIKNGFVWDDSYLVRDNYYIRDIGNIKTLLTMEDKPATFSGTGYFRPFINMTYLLDYYVYSGEAYGFRLTNIAFHIACVIMLYFLVLLITGDRMLSLAASVIFSAQAVHVEAVTFISGRNNVICTLFILLSLYYYVRSKRGASRTDFALSMLFLFIGAASKEFAFVLPAIFFLYDYSFDKEFALRKRIGAYAASFAVLASFMAFRAATVPMKGAFALNYPTMYNRLINTFRIFVNYIRAQIIPDSLSLYFDLPLEDSFLAPSILVSFIALAALTLLVIRIRKKERIIFFSFFTYLLLLLPVSNIVQIPGSLMADRWLYPASAAFALFLARLIQIALKKKEAFIPVAVILFSGFLSVFTIQRNHVFKNDFLLFSDVLKTFPESSMALNNLGVEMKKMGYEKEAEEFYSLAMKYDPDYNLPYNNLGVIYASRGENEKALEHFKKAYELNPGYALTSYNMGITYKDLDDIEESCRYFRIAISLNPQNYSAYYNLASNYYGQKKYEEALEVMRDAALLPLNDRDKNEVMQKIGMLKGLLKAAESAE